MSLERKEIFEFGEFRLDVKEHTIERKDGIQNGILPEKAFQVLILLVRRHGHLLTKDELIKAVWPDSVVEENNLDKCIHHIRHYLGEKHDNNKYIETVRKHGYRFVRKVEKVEVSFSWLPATYRDMPGQDCEPSAVEETQISDPALSRRSGSLTLLGLFVGGLLLALLIVFAVYTLSSLGFFSR